MRHVFLKVATGDTCKDSDDYRTCALARWDEVAPMLNDAASPFFKRVKAVAAVDTEAMYEPCGLVFEVLLKLEPAENGTGPPDVSKPELSKALVALWTKGVVMHKRVVPAPMYPMPPAAS